MYDHYLELYYKRPRGEGGCGRKGVDGASTDRVTPLGGEGEGSRGEQRRVIAGPATGS